MHALSLSLFLSLFLSLSKYIYLYIDIFEYIFVSCIWNDNIAIKDIPNAF